MIPMTNSPRFGYDISGLVKPSGFVVNDFGRPFFILTRDQWDALVAEAREALQQQHDDGEDWRDGRT